MPRGTVACRHGLAKFPPSRQAAVATLWRALVVNLNKAGQDVGSAESGFPLPLFGFADTSGLPNFILERLYLKNLR